MAGGSGGGESESGAAVPAAGDVPAEGSAQPQVVVKKYANRRLYNTEASSYVTLEDLAGMVREGRDFVVYDAKSGEDITRSVLTQIIVEEEAKGRNLLPTPFLRQLIGFYGDSLQALVPRYLEFAMSSFHRQQEQMRRTMEQTMGGFLPFPPGLQNLEELGKQNMAMMERAMSLFSPFLPPGGTGAPGPGTGRGEGEQPARHGTTGGGGDQSVESLKAEIEALKRELADLRAREGGKTRGPA